jgi:hypothetical protein
MKTVKTVLSTRWVLFILSVVLLLPNFNYNILVNIPTEANGGHRRLGERWEQYDASLARQLTSVNDILAYSEKLAREKNIQKGTLEYASLVGEVVSKRFFHGYSHYATGQNWLAALAGKYVWWDLSALVRPDDIMKYPMGACSQQSIVLMECFRRIDIPVRKLGFQHHFAMEANINGTWYFFDPNMEPKFPGGVRKSYAELQASGQAYELYKDHISMSTFNFMFANPQYGTTNTSPALRAELFQSVTAVLSKSLWLLPFLGFLFSFLSTRLFFRINWRRSPTYPTMVLQTR